VKVKKLKMLALSVVAVLVAGSAVILLADVAHAGTTCNRRLLMAGPVSQDGTYGYTGIPTIGNDSSCRLRQGDRTGTERQTSPVWWLQRTLNQCYGQSLVLDGAYGPKTTRAVKAAQATVPGLASDGVYGPRTRSALRWYAERTTAHGGSLGKCVPFGSLE
jgi:hypothetical protein